MKMFFAFLLLKQIPQKIKFLVFIIYINLLLCWQSSVNPEDGKFIYSTHLADVFLPKVQVYLILFSQPLTFQESEFDSNKRSDSPSDDLPSTPRVISTNPNPKYQLFLNNEVKTNGLSSRDADGPGGSGSVGENGPRLARWETTRLGMNHFRGSLESLASRDWDTMSDRVGVTHYKLCMCICF